jgi:hypothetical protein
MMGGMACLDRTRNRFGASSIRSRAQQGESKRMLSRRGVVAAAGLMPFLGSTAIALAPGTTSLLIRDNRLFLDLVVNGHPVRGLLDSAAESSFIDAGFAHSIGIAGGDNVRTRGSGGDTTAALAKGVTIEALGIKLGPMTVAVLDLGGVSRRLLHGPLAVVLGRELFEAARLEIDIAHATIRQVSRGSEPRGVRLALSTERGCETFPASAEGHPPVATVFDLGNGSDVLVGEQYANNMGFLSDGRVVVRKRGGGIGGEIVRQAITLRSLDIAGHRFENVAASVDATGSAAALNVGVSLLRKFNIVTDYSQHCLWLDG